jgi:GNAT superfamily N-acetyltransferase
MNIEPFCADDIGIVLKLAAAEGWVAEPWEFEFLLSEFAQGCFVARNTNCETVGFVTSLRHERSGWIGNLIVCPEYRGKGIGGLLFNKALETVRDSGADTVWLTASKSGMPLYQKAGFTRIDTILRWSGCSRQQHTGHETEVACDSPDPLLIESDGLAWGDRRSALVAATVNRGKLLQQKSGFVVVQPCGTARQFGPFSAPGYSAAEALFKTALNTIPFGTGICLDAPSSNRMALLLFNRNRMRITGSNELMYAGARPAYQPEYIYGLATMGSCG